MTIDITSRYPFHPITIQDAEIYRSFEKQDYLDSCDRIFGSVLFWSETYLTEFATICDCAVLRYRVNSETWFSFPTGGTEENKRDCIALLLDYCQNVTHDQLRFSVITEVHKAFLLKHFPYIFEIDILRDRFDYVYETERLSSLKGKKLSSKRNHIHRFTEKGDWVYEDITPDNLEECWEMEEDWISIQEVDDEERMELEDEKKAVRMAMDHFQELELIGGLIRQNGKIVAFTIGERLNSETVVCHFEKAYFNIQGAYQIINQQFLLHHKDEFRYVNREDDAGNPGLRKSKLSYYPDLLIRKYLAVSSDIIHATKDDSEDILKLWEECFGDEPEYIHFYMENRFTEENMLVIRKDNRIVSMASFWDAFIKIGETEHPVKYVYAVATSASYRNQGYAKYLLMHALDKYRLPLILQPGSASLFDYYEKMGFQRIFRPYDIVYRVSDCSSLNEDKAAAFILYENPSEEMIRKYFTFRNAALEGTSFVSWDEAAISYALKENAYCCGSVAMFEDGAIMYRIQNGVIVILEYAISEKNQASYTEILLKCLGKEEARYQNHGGMILTSSDCAQILSQTGEIYLGLTIA